MADLRIIGDNLRVTGNGWDSRLRGWLGEGLGGEKEVVPIGLERTAAWFSLRGFELIPGRSHI